MIKADVIVPIACTLGESPMWHASRKSIWWVDIQAGYFFEYNYTNKVLNKWQAPQKVSLLVQCSTDPNMIILAVQDGLLKFDIDKNVYHRVLYLEQNLADNRTNDGACDALGRLWLGTMDVDCKPGSGKLYSIDKDLNIFQRIDNTTISNGVCWSLENDKMYYIDSASYSVQSYFFNLQKGEILFEKTIIEMPVETGMPDGMAIDIEGMLWIAQWGGFAVNRWNPNNGELLDKIKLPVPHVTSCAFGGEKLDRLFITTASEGLSENDRKKYSDSGSLFMVELNVKGAVRNRCAF